MMTYSVITICLNSSESISRTIMSVLKQSVLPKEYIFVDGGSKDNTIDLIRDCFSTCHASPMIKWKILHQEQKLGVYAALNIGLDQVSSDIVFILHSDDYYEPNTAENVLSAFERYTQADIVIGSIKCFSNHGDKKAKIVKCSYRWMFPILFPLKMPVRHPACFVRRKVYQKVGLFDDQYIIAGDYDFLYRCYKSGIVFQKVDNILVNMQLGGLSERRKDVAINEAVKIALNHCGNRMLVEMARFFRLRRLGKQNRIGR